MNKIFFLILIVCLISSISYCVSSSSANSINEPRAKIVNRAVNLIGSPYLYGGKGPSGFDCSGLVHFLMAEMNIKMNASAQTQSTQGTVIKLKEALPGDLLFFKRPNEKNIFHVSIIQKINNDQLWIIHSTSSQGVISQEFYGAEYWSSKLFKVTRVVR